MKSKFIERRIEELDMNTCGYFENKQLISDYERKAKELLIAGDREGYRNCLRNACQLEIENKKVLKKINTLQKRYGRFIKD